jgi:formylglycine-generating enzyme required for sulfatase activity
VTCPRELVHAGANPLTKWGVGPTLSACATWLDRGSKRNPTQPNWDGTGRDGCMRVKWFTVQTVFSGSWVSYPGYLRSAIRGRNGPDYRGSGVGFRVARTLR